MFGRLWRWILGIKPDDLISFTEMIVVADDGFMERLQATGVEFDKYPVKCRSNGETYSLVAINQSDMPAVKKVAGSVPEPPDAFRYFVMGLSTHALSKLRWLTLDQPDFCFRIEG